MAAHVEDDDVAIHLAGELVFQMLRLKGVAGHRRAGHEDGNCPLRMLPKDAIEAAGFDLESGIAQFGPDVVDGEAEQALTKKDPGCRPKKRGPRGSRQCASSPPRRLGVRPSTGIPSLL